MSRQDEPLGERDAILAVHAVGRGDLPAAVEHLGRALAMDPDHREWRAILDAVLDGAPQPLSLVKMEEAVPPASAAAHAYALARKGETEEAIALLLEVAAACPELPYLTWAIPWVDGEAGAITLARLLDERDLLGRLAAVLDRLTPPFADDDPRRATCDALLVLLDRVHATRPGAAATAILRGTLLRRLGRLDLALELAQREVAARPTWAAAAELACTYRALGETDLAINAYMLAAAMEPGAVAVRLDLGDVLLEADRIEEARAEYALVLTHMPDHAWALPSLLFADALAHDDEAAKERLLRLADSAPGSRADVLARRIDRPEPYVNTLPAFEETSARATREAARKMRDWPASATEDEPAVLEVTAPRAEPPSVRAAFALNLRRIGQRAVLRVRGPAPRPGLLWRDDGDGPVPAAEPPTDDVARVVVAIAERRFRLPAWFELAKDAGVRLGPGALASLLGAMVHPPPLPSEHDAWEWTLRVQIAAALVIASLDAGWVGSLRRDALLALVRGAPDWTAAAAALALAEVGREEPAARREVSALFATLASTAEGSTFVAALETARRRLDKGTAAARAAR